VISLLSIFAGVVLTQFEPAIHDQLQGAAQTISSDFAYARDLAVTNATNYQIAFNIDENRYVLTHSGTNPAFDDLPPSPFRLPSDSAGEQTTDLSRLPSVGVAVELVSVQRQGASLEDVSTVEFGPLGETTRSEETVVWIAAGQGTTQRFISVRVDPATGMAWIGQFQSEPPPDAGS
jgi:hypothetical protein